jgi:hypothetical protein
MLGAGDEATIRAMCEMINVFVPVRHPAVGPEVRGFSLGTGGEVQRDFAERYARAHGTILVGKNAKTCLCGFGDWEAFYDVARDILTRNAIATLAVVRFWSGDRYTLTERAIDPDDAELCTPVELGEVVVLCTGPPEQRRHRIVVRTLARKVGEAVTLHMKGGRELKGTLVAFDVESEVGHVGTGTFVAAQVHDVEG